MSLSDYLLAEIKEIAKDQRSQKCETACAGASPSRHKSIPLCWYEKNAKRDDCPGCFRCVDWLLQTSSRQRIERRIYGHSETLRAPHLLDLEITVLRFLTQQGIVSGRRADETVRDLVDLPLTRYPHLVLLPRIWQLRHNFSAYDAAYIMLAEKLDAPPNHA